MVYLQRSEMFLYPGGLSLNLCRFDHSCTYTYMFTWVLQVVVLLLFLLVVMFTTWYHVGSTYTHLGVYLYIHLCGCRLDIEVSLSTYPGGYMQNLYGNKQPRLIFQEQILGRCIMNPPGYIITYEPMWVSDKPTWVYNCQTYMALHYTYVGLTKLVYPLGIQ